MKDLAAPSSRLIVIGKFGAVHGIRGWIKVHSFTSPLNNIIAYQPWQLEDEAKTYVIEDHRFHGKQLQVKLEGIDTPEAAKTLTNKQIVTTRDKLPNTAPDEYYWDDLIGLNVISINNEPLGKVDQLIATGANDVLVVVGDKRRLIPFIDSVIQNVDLTNQTITVDWDLTL